MMLVVVAARRGRRVRAEQGRRRRHGGRDGRRRRGRGTPVEVLLNRVGGLQQCNGTGEIRDNAEMIHQKEVA